MSNALSPKLLTVIDLPNARATALQFRYLFVADTAGLRVVDVTHPAAPELLPATIPLRDARRIYVARTFAYVADGADGLAIIDVERPRAPRLYHFFNDCGSIKY